MDFTKLAGTSRVKYYNKLKYLAMRDMDMGKTPMSLPPRRKAALSFWPFHQKKIPMKADTCRSKIKLWARQNNIPDDV